MIRTWNPDVTGPALLFVKADWCPHCTSTKPAIREVARSLARADIKVYAVDADKHADQVRKLNVVGFPTILFLHESGRTKVFPGGDRSAHRIESWVCTVSGACGV